MCHYLQVHVHHLSGAAFLDVCQTLHQELYLLGADGARVFTDRTAKTQNSLMATHIYFRTFRRPLQEGISRISSHLPTA